MGKVRYSSVAKAYPEEAEELFTEAEKMAKARYRNYILKSQENWESVNLG
jgi:pyruvate-ferredoxin/flavodoxin oxidoreductase